MTFSEVLQQAISLAKEAYEARMTGGRDDDSPLVTSGQDPSVAVLATEERRLAEFLNALPAPAVYMLTAIQYLGRGDFGVRDLHDQYVDISESFGGPKLAARQLLETLLLADYLEEGCKKLVRARIAVDKLLKT
jgi:hypothetical protein